MKNKNGKKLRLKKSVKHIGAAVLGLIVVLIAIVVIYSTQIASPIKSTVKAEAGTEVDVTNFVKKSFFISKSREFVLQDDISGYLKTVGENEVTITEGEKEYKSKLVVNDTVAPVAEAKTAEGYTKHKVKAKKLVTKVTDATKVTYAFKEEPDFNKAGNQPVTILLTDEGNNVTEVESTLKLKKDTKAPVIKGAKDITVKKGGTVSYRKGVTVTDNVDKDLKFKVDNTKVNLDKVGSYKVTYTATDLSGNKAKKTITVKVIVASLGNATTADVYAMIDPILSSIYKKSASERTKALAIYNYVRSHVRYVDSSNKKSWQYGAMFALTYGKGDCYNYWALSKAMLTRAGIKNMDLTASTRSHHYWNFVRINGKWYHFDTTPRYNHPNLFLRTDAFVTSYSRSNGLCFKWNQTNKPASARSDG